MKAQVKQFLRILARYPLSEWLIRTWVNVSINSNPDISVSSTYERSNVMQFALDVNDEMTNLLDEIPSETSDGERRFLYKFFSTVWSGKNDVIEIGPFLGGTTRAIALGMQHNPKMTGASKLYTYDRFRGYYDPKRLSYVLEPLVKNGTLKRSETEVLGTSAEFIDIFKSIHARHPYSDILIPYSQELPGSREELQSGKQFFHLDKEVLSDAVFIDGCKSWFGTKYFMIETSKACDTGTYFIFQDYGWYTCFWLPAFIALFPNHFNLIGYVNTTYVFMLKKRLNRDTIDALYPDTPSILGEAAIIDLFDKLISDAKKRKDFFAVVRHTIQKGGAVAYIGNKLLAKKIIEGLVGQPYAVGHKSIIRDALRSPTYTPDEQIFL